MTDEGRIELQTTLPANVYQHLQNFLDINPDWSQDDAIEFGVLLFLSQLCEAAARKASFDKVATFRRDDSHPLASSPFDSFESQAIILDKLADDAYLNSAMRSKKPG